MPVIIPKELPAKAILENENIFVMTTGRAEVQEIRPLCIGVLNLMPLKEDTELQLLRLIGNSPLQVEVTFLRTATYSGTHTSKEHLESFYTTFDEVKKSGRKFDGLIVTGAPVEKMKFTDVKYWNEFKEIAEWSQHNVYSTFYICWAAQAAFYHFYGIDKRELPKKLSGVYLHKTHHSSHPLVRNFDEYFYAPHSRHTDVRISDVKKNENIDILATSKDAGLYLAASKDGRKIFAFGHSEYDKLTLDSEFKRDIKAGLSDVKAPVGYYGDDGKPILRWRAHSALLFMNWLNYFVYQATPYDITDIN